MNYKKYLKNLYPVIAYIFKIHLLALVILSLLRLVLFLTNLDSAEHVDTVYLTGAFSLGIFFDNIGVAFTSVLPIIAALILSFFDSYKDVFRKLFNAYYIIAYTFIFAFCVANIPYFNYFFRHLDIGILDWLSHDTEGISMLFTESGYYKYYLLFFLIIIGFSLCVVFFGRQWKKYKNRVTTNIKLEITKLLVVFILLSTITYMGVTRKHHWMQPIMLWTAYLSPSSFANELTTSPLYNCMVSVVTPKYKDKEVSHVISTDDSFKLLRQDFANQEIQEEISPVCRKITPEESERRANVVIVLMESMSSYYLDETPHLTPFLNELKNKSYYFKNFYSPGTHTNQGIFATLYGIPGLFDRVIMDDRVMSGTDRMPLCEGLPVNLNMKGYTSSLFVSHDKSYNNTDMFLYRNGYEINNIYAKENYPESKIVNEWGVDDAYLLEYAIDIFNKEKAPFFATIMTITNHPPYVVPKEYESISKDGAEQTVYYSDQCIKKFLEEASKQDWYNNTIFVFLGDHGKKLGGQLFEMSLPLNHVPLMIYSPLLEDMPKTFDNYGTQTDIFPTVMGLLNMEYENNSLGIDLLKEKRPYAVFTSDEKLGCINDRYFYCYNILSKQEVMYDYKSNDITNLATTNKNAFDSIRSYAAATVQATNYLLKNELTRRKDLAIDKK
ncbi:LTA synthase family protein [Prevotella sp. 10(H)]|uniref:LTA synthase family protein n=1 Tax=Prevotella sp. 10(H) TaxID=1158294 RepID=UPI0004A76322|nr:alkaline phosphatase family protein [Prevotella sp. 10(H)]